MAAQLEISRIVVTFSEEREELAKIEAIFTEIKGITGLKKAELYGKALKWIANNEIAKAKFIEYLMNEKAKNEMVEIIK